MNRMRTCRVAVFRAMVFAAAAIFMPSALSAALYYWQGNEDSDPLEPSNYKTSGGTVLTERPAPGDSVRDQRDNMTIKFTDDTIAYLGTLDTYGPRTGGRVIIDISTNVTIGTKFNLWGTGYVVKRGAGNLMFAPSSLTYDSQNRCYDYRERFIVEKGDVIFPQEVASSGKGYFHGSLAVSNGCTVVMEGGHKSSENHSIYFTGGICGDGNLMCTNSTAECRLYVCGGTEPFSGELTGANIVLYVNGPIMLAGTNNTFKSIYHKGGTVGARKFGNKTDTSSLGAYNNEVLNTDYHGDMGFLCLATEADGVQSCYRTLRDYDASARLVFDGGAYGGLKLGAPWNSTAMIIQVYFGKYMKEMVLTGSNTEECVFACNVVPSADHAESEYGYYYLTKKGTGTWRMSVMRTEVLKKLAGIGVENGTLRFDTIAERGSYCSFGLSTNLFGYAYKGTIASAPPEVDYAIRLGNAANLEEEGTFEYMGPSSSPTETFCETRKIAVTGNGRLKNGSSVRLNWRGVKSVPMPDGSANPALSTLTLDGDTAPGFLTDVTEEPGAAPLKIAKDGESSWHLEGNLTFSGGIDVKKGLLTLSNCRNWNWYRLVMKQNKGCGATDGDWRTNAVYIGELGLFDANGNRLNESLVKGPDTAKTNPYHLSPGRMIVDCNQHSTSTFARMFDGDGTKNSLFQFAKPLSEEDPTSWKHIYMHLEGGKSAVSSFDISYPNGIGGAYKYSELTHFAIEGSTDGSSWHTITNVTDFTFANKQKWSISGAGITLGGTVTGGAPLDTAIPAEALPEVLPNGISSLKVDHGATFTVYGEPLAVSNVVVDVSCGGVGTITGVSFASEGVITVENLPVGGAVMSSGNLMACEGGANISRWRVETNQTKMYKVSVTAAGIKVYRPGTTMVLR